jgi:hypothetical protein
MALLYRCHNGASAAAAAPVKVATGAAIRTMLQVLHPTQPLAVVAYGCSFDGTTAAVPVEVELITTGTIAATVTAFVANDVTCYNGQPDPSLIAGGLTLSSSGSGYSASVEGTVVAPVRDGDLQLVAPSNQDVYQWPLAQSFWVPVGNVLRVRMTAAATVNAYAWVVFGVGGD